MGARLSPSGFPTMPAADRVEQIWDEMLQACATDADAAEGIVGECSRTRTG